jgi:hypothetical protein
MRIKLADVNRLVVLVEDSTIKLFLNSSLVAEYKDPSFTGGTVGHTRQLQSSSTSTTSSCVADHSSVRQRRPGGLARGARA